jgi:hypothetical protein
MATIINPYYYVPDSWNFSRFLKNVIELEGSQGMVTGMIRQLREEIIQAALDP